MLYGYDMVGGRPNASVNYSCKHLKILCYLGTTRRWSSAQAQFTNSGSVKRKLKGVYLIYKG
jgi:hypothetical protein